MIAAAFAVAALALYLMPTDVRIGALIGLGLLVQHFVG